MKKLFLPLLLAVLLAMLNACAPVASQSFEFAAYARKATRIHIIESAGVTRRSYIVSSEAQKKEVVDMLASIDMSGFEEIEEYDGVGGWGADFTIETANGFRRVEVIQNNYSPGLTIIPPPVHDPTLCYDEILYMRVWPAEYSEYMVSGFPDSWSIDDVIDFCIKQEPEYIFKGAPFEAFPFEEFYRIYDVMLGDTTDLENTFVVRMLDSSQSENILMKALAARAKAIRYKRYLTNLTFHYPKPLKVLLYRGIQPA